MNTLKQVTHYPDTNSVEATWVERLTEKEYYTGEDGEGCVLEAGDEIVIKCHSYADVQMQMFRDDVAEFGGNIAEYEVLIALVESNIKPVEPEPISVPQEISKAQGISVMSQTIIGESNLWLMVKGYFDTEASEVERDLFKAITVFNRASPMLNNLKGLFNLTDADTDQLFIEGAKVLV